MSRKTIVSITLDDQQITRLQKIAAEKHKGNRSQAIRSLLMQNVSLDLGDYEHPYPPSSRNWLGTGRCNPHHATQGVCVLCWGENATVMTYKDWNGKNRIVVETFGGETNDNHA